MTYFQHDHAVGALDHFLAFLAFAASSSTFTQALTAGCSDTSLQIALSFGNGERIFLSIPSMYPAVRLVA